MYLLSLNSIKLMLTLFYDRTRKEIENRPPQIPSAVRRRGRIGNLVVELNNRPNVGNNKIIVPSAYTSV